MKFWNRHLKEVNEGYFEHMRNAMSFSMKMLIGAAACAIHALLPFLFERTGSDQIRRLHERMIVQRLRPARQEDATNSGVRINSV